MNQNEDARLLAGVGTIETQQPAEDGLKERVGGYRGKPRLKAVLRDQLLMRVLDVEKLIEADHPARGIWEIVGRLDMSGFEKQIKAIEGQPGQSRIDPRVLTALWIYGNSQGVGSARELSRMCEYEPGCQWLTGMEPVNYHTLADFRVDNKIALDELFVQVLGLLSAEGLIELKQVTQDGTKIRANAGTDTFRREERLRQHLELARQQVEQLSDPHCEELSQRVAKARQRAIREKRQRLELALEELKKLQENKQSSEKEYTRVSLTDPEARQMKQSDGGFAPSYNVQVSTDVAHGIVVALGVTQAGNDMDQLITGVKQVQQNLGSQPAQLITDAGYVSDGNVEAIEERGIELIAPVPEKNPEASLRKRGVSREFYPDAFDYDAATNSYRCPAGKRLKLRQSRKYPGRIEHNYRARPADCRACPFQDQCCGKSRVRLIVRSEPSPKVAAFRRRMDTVEAQQIYRKRAEVAEFVNAWLKDKIGLRQFHVRGRIKVLSEVLWAILTYNIQQWMRLCWKAQLHSI
jgi:transposase